MSLMDGCLPASTVQELGQAIEGAQSVLWSMGLTGVHDGLRR